MIVVLGRPALAVGAEGASAAASEALAGLAARIAVAAADRGSRVELVGSIGDDPEGDRVVVELGRRGVGHAALLRDPAGATPVDGGQRSAPLPRLEAGDVELGLRYLTEYRVLIVAEPLPSDAEAAALDAAAYHGASVVAIVPAGSQASAAVEAVATVLQEPTVEGTEEADSGDADRSAAFAAFVGAFAARLDTGQAPGDALREAVAGTGWERASGD